MINAAIVGLGRWGQRLVTSVQGKSERIRFVRGMVRNPDRVRDFSIAHDFSLSANFGDVLSDGRRRAARRRPRQAALVFDARAEARRRQRWGSAEAIGETELVVRMSGEKPQRFDYDPVDQVRVELELFADALGGGAPYPTSGKQIVATVAAFEAAAKSMETREAVVVE